MIFGPVALAQAEGAVLAHSLTVAGARWAKGRVLGAADIAAAAAAGLAELTVARLEPGDVPEDEAAAMLAAALAGPGVAALAPVHGRVNLVATAAGLVRLDAAAIDAVNAVGEALTVGTAPDWARVARGDVVATIKVIPYAVPDAEVAAARVAAGLAAVSLLGFRPIAVDLVLTLSGPLSAKAQAKTEAVTRARLAALGVNFVNFRSCDHALEPLADMLRQPGSVALTLVAGASATSDRGDVIPAAIVAAGGRVERLGMPVDPGNLLVLGYIGDRPVVGLPGCARSPKRNGFDWVLERLVAGIAVTSADIAAMGVGGLLADAERPEPRALAATPGPVGAIVLAAGRSTRMGSNKLLADLHGKPVVAHVVDTIAEAGLPPPLVVLGNMGAEVRAALGQRPAQYVHAPDFAEGLSRSLRAGLAAAPEAWRGALVCLGDMPRVTPATLAALARAAVGEGSVAVPVAQGKRGNPVLWGRAHFARLSGLDGDVGGKALLAELEDALVEVPVEGEGIFADVDTPEALAALRASGP